MEHFQQCGSEKSGHVKRQAEDHLTGIDLGKDDKPPRDGFFLFVVLLHPGQISAISEIGNFLIKLIEEILCGWDMSFLAPPLKLQRHADGTGFHLLLNQGLTSLAITFHPDGMSSQYMVNSCRTGDFSRRLKKLAKLKIGDFSRCSFVSGKI